MRQHTIIVSIFMVTLMPLACKGNGSSINLAIKAKSADGFPVAGAIATLDDNVIGETNGFGTLNIKIDITGDSRHKLTLTKDDEKYYFAPHIETFTTNAEETKNVVVDALMYTVPKPKLSKKIKSEAQNKEQTPTTNLNASIYPEKSNLGMLPLLNLPSEQFNNSSTENTARESINQIFTVHVYSGRFPVGNASVTFSSSTGDVSNCASNERGRCVLETSYYLPADGTLTIQRDGYRSISIPFHADESTNYRLSIEPGSSLDVMAEVSGPWKSLPAENIVVRIKNLKPSAVMASTNKSGFATIPIEAKFPLEVELFNKITGAMQKHIVEDSKSLQIKARFSDESMSGWSQWHRYPIHLNEEAAKESGLVDYERLEASLQNRYPDQPQDQDPRKFNSLSRDAIAILPLVRKNEKGTELGIAAFTSKGKIAESLFTTIATSSITEEQWLNAYETAVRNLNQKLPWPGTVQGIKNRELVVSIKTDFLGKDDRLTIETPQGPMSATITKLGRTEARVSLDMASHLNAADLVKIIGARAQKIVHSAQSSGKESVIDIEKLISIKTEHKGRRLAKKYLAENNQDAALEILLSSLDPNAPSLEDLQMAAVIESHRSKIDGLTSVLKRMLSTAVKTGATGAIPIIETNLLLVQVETMPAIPNDKQAADRFLEIMSKTKELKAEISPQSETSPESIALSYIRLTAQQKAAESADDTLMLATMADAWSVFEKALVANGVGTQEDAWKAHASKQKSRSSLGMNLEKTSL